MRTWTSTDSSNFARLRSLTRRDRLGRRVLALAVDLVAGLEVVLAVLGHQPITSTPIERAVPAMIFAAWSTSLRVEVGQLLLGDRRGAGPGDLADLVAVRLAGALVEVDRLLDEHGGRRRLGDERERAVLVDRDHDRDRRARVLLGLRVERLAELHDVDAVLAQRRADRRRRGGLAAHGLQLDRV